MCFIRAQTKTQPYWSLIPIAARASRPAGSRISFYTPNLRPPHFQARAERALRLSAVSRRRGSESTSQTPPNPLLFHRELIRYLTHHALEKYFFKEIFFSHLLKGGNPMQSRALYTPLPLQKNINTRLD
jgi:hypothetical protein